MVVVPNFKQVDKRGHGGQAWQAFSAWGSGAV